ncbi:MAG: S-layer homology domain-containing protein [Candidatus Heteroscillospira sp.]
MKRTLALVLALVMVIGMMAVPASADFSDSKDVKYTEAVEVVAAAGIIEGFEDGSFDPDGTLTREQAAKVVAYMLLGEKNADALKATSAPFADVAANRWSAGYIAYVANEGIINGRDDKTFDPTGKVTAFEFAKLMLGALGYSASIEQYTGSSWAINVGKTALDIGMFDGNEGADYNAAATREEAALYIFNTLQADLVAYENKGSEIDLGNGIIISTGASKAEAVTSSKKYDTIKDDKDSDDKYTVQFAEKYFEDLELDVDADAFGRPANIWNYDNDEVGTYAQEADETYTVATKGKDIYADLGKPDDAEFTYFVDGDELTADEIKGEGYYEDFVITSGTAGDKKIGGNGVLVEVFDMDDNEYTVVVINTYVAEIAAWNEADEDDDEDESVDIDPIGYSAPDGDLIVNFETTQFTEDDEDDETVVLYTAALNSDDKYEVKSVVAAESVTGFISSTKGDSSFVLGGETYKYSENSEGEAKYEKDAEDATAYVDAYGYVIYIDMEAAASDKYAYIEDATIDEDAWGEKTYYAKLVLENGETVTATVDNYYDTNNDKITSGITEDSFDGEIVSYKVNSDGEYIIYQTGAELSATADAKFEINTGRSAIVATKGEDTKTVANANSKTVFIIAEQDDDDWEYTTYTGIKNVPDVDGGKYAIYSDDNYARVVVVVDPTASSTSTDEVVFVAYDEDAVNDVISGADYDDYVVVYAYVDGEIVELKVAEDSDLYTELEKGNDIIGKSISYDKDGLATKVTGTPDTEEGTAASKIEDDVITVDGTGYTVDTDCVTYTVEDGEISKGGSVRANSEVVIVLDDDLVTTIFILK